MNDYFTETQQRVDHFRLKAEQARIAAADAFTSDMRNAFEAIARTWDQMADAELASARHFGAPLADQPQRRA